MNAQDLKNSILQRAIEGKLVPQRAEEGTARDLLAEIRAEKEKLIKEKKIKKTKPLPEISDDEKPFEIPESWEWVRLSDVIDVRDGTHNTPPYYKTGVPLVTSKNLSNGQLDFSDVKYISEDNAMEINKRSKVEKGDILFAMIGSIGNPVLVTEDRAFCIKNVALFKNFSTKINMKYIFWLLVFLQNEMKTIASGGVQSFISLKVFRNYIIPLPPIAEQHRIVARIEELQPDIDAYDKAQTELRTIEQRFPDDMKKSLLQYAIEGKLVPQRKEEGTARDLLAEIRAEKEKLIKEKKIKKTKPLPEITDDEKPFDIPDSWEWVKLGEISTYGYKTNKITASDMEPDMWILDLQDIEKDTGHIIRHKFVKCCTIKGDRTIFHKGDLLYSKLRPYLKKILIAPADGICTSELVPFQVYKGINAHYILWWLHSPFITLKVNASSYGVKMPRVGKETMINLLVPLPPLAEQHRIVARLEEMLPFCRQLAGESE
ncbi:restriction endonuclease subunit S [Megasphaera elsdenii]|uniref:restriction endonuclease subunit S n=1 Tax=Megasphaera elsdenii TaxID=907 RepID=UPI002432B999|nr:restriction endonuclease subunit S [Megasphaera elsdenii]